MKTMILFAAAGLMALTSCSNDDEPQVEQYGTISLGMSSDITVSTRAEQILDAVALADYQITIEKSSSTVKSGKYSKLFTNNTMQLAVGTGYTLTAANCTDTEAESANDGEGQMQLKGTSDPFAVQANLNTSVNVKCTVANAQVSVKWAESITGNNAFTNLSAEVYENSKDTRKFTFNNNESDPKPWFNIDSDPKLAGTISYTFNGNAKSYLFSNIAIAAAKHIILNVTASGDNGQITVTITVDNTVTDEKTDIPTNPYDA